MPASNSFASMARSYIKINHCLYRGQHPLLAQQRSVGKLDSLFLGIVLER
jgi:hypothetical protein